METQNIRNRVIIGRDGPSKYLWSFFLTAYNYEEIIIEFHDKYAGTANSIIDGLRQNFGWKPVNRERVKKIARDRKTGQEYEVVVNQVLMQKLGAIRGIE